MSPRKERCARNWLLDAPNVELPSDDVFVGETGVEEDPISEENCADDDVDMVGNDLKDALALEDDVSMEGDAIDNGDVEDDNAEDDDTPHASDVVIYGSGVVIYSFDVVLGALDVGCTSTVVFLFFERSPEKERR